MPDDSSRNGSNGFLTGGGDTGDLMRSIDWAKTAVGAVEAWPQSLRTAVSILMESRLTFAESWHIIGPMFDGVMAGTAVGAEDWMLPLDRHGYLEECYFTFSYGPIRAENGVVAGVHVTVTETTARVLHERRLRTLRAVASAAEAKVEDQAWSGASHALSQNIEDLPFALLYAADADGETATLVGSTLQDMSNLPARVALDSESSWPCGVVAVENQPKLVTDVSARFGALVGAKWPEPVATALALPIARAGLSAPYGFLIAGISPRRALDEEYRGFLILIANHRLRSGGGPPHCRELGIQRPSREAGRRRTTAIRHAADDVCGAFVEQPEVRCFHPNWPG